MHELESRELDGLRPPRLAMAPSVYAARTWRLRHYIKAEARSRVASSHSDLAFGRFWLVLEPALYVSVYYVLFGLALKTGRDLDAIDYLSYLVVGKVSFQFVRRGVLSCAGSTKTAELGDPEVPAVVKPLSRIVRGVMVYRFEITVAIIVCLTRGASVRLAWLLLLPLTALSVLSSLGLGLWLGRGIMRVPDVKNTLPHFMRLAFYSSGVIFPVEIYIRETENGEFLLDLYTLLNPFFAMVKLHQGAILGYDQYPVQMAVMATVLWSFLFVMLGIRSIIRAEAEHQE